MTPPVTLEVSEGIARIGLSRPAHGDAIDLPLARALRDTAAEVAALSTVDAAILFGHGEAFGVGGISRRSGRPKRRASSSPNSPPPRARRVLGPARTGELTRTNHKLEGTEAERIGLVSRTVEAGTAYQEAVGLGAHWCADHGKRSPRPRNWSAAPAPIHCPNSSMPKPSPSRP